MVFKILAILLQQHYSHCTTTYIQHGTMAWWSFNNKVDDGFYTAWHNGMMEFQQWSWWWILYSMAQWHDGVSTMKLMMDSIQHGTMAWWSFNNEVDDGFYTAWHNGMMEFQQWSWWWILYSMAQWHDGVLTMKLMMDSIQHGTEAWWSFNNEVDDGFYTAWRNGMMEFQQWSWWWILYSMAQWHDGVSTIKLMMDSIQHGTEAWWSFNNEVDDGFYTAWRNGMMEFQQWN